MRLSLGHEWAHCMHTGDSRCTQTHTHTFSHSFQPQGALPGRNVSWPLQEGRNQRNLHHFNPHSTASPSVCVCVWAGAWLATELHAHISVWRVWKCVGACALVGRSVCHVSVSAAASTQPHLFPKLIIFPSCQARQWCHRVSVEKRGKKREGPGGRKMEEMVAEERSLITYRAPSVFYKSTANSTWA